MRYLEEESAYEPQNVNLSDAIETSLKKLKLKAFARFSGGSENRTAILCQKSRGLKAPYRVAVTEGDNVLAVFPDAVACELSVPLSLVLLNGKVVVWSNKLSRRRASFECFDLNTLTLSSISVLSEEEKGLAPECQIESLDVDTSGRYLLIFWISDDPDFPKISVYDSTLGDFLRQSGPQERLDTEFDCEDLIDSGIEKAKWGATTSVISCTQFDEPIELSIDLEKRVVKMQNSEVDDTET